MSEYWDERNEPPWGESELLAEVESLIPSRHRPIGCSAVENAFEAVEGIAGGCEGPKGKPAKRYLTADEAEALALEGDGEALIKGWLDCGGLICAYGPPGAGKSAVLLGIALSIAAGALWAGNRTKKGLVVYVALERAVGLRKRIKAARKRLNLPVGLPLVVLNFRPDFATGPKGALQIIEAVRAAEAQFGEECAMVIVDTVARAMSGLKENDSADMGAFVDRCARVQDATGAAVLLIHHSGKDGSKGARGSNALLGAIDTEIEIADGVIRVTKESEREAPRPLRFTIEGVEIGKSARGEPISAAYANVTHGASRAGLTPAEMEYVSAFEVVQDRLILTEEGDSNPPVSGVEWNAEADLQLSPSSTRGRSKRTRNDMRRNLVDKGWIAKSSRKPGYFERSQDAEKAGGI